MSVSVLTSEVVGVVVVGALVEADDANVNEELKASDVIV